MDMVALCKLRTTIPSIITDELLGTLRVCSLVVGIKQRKEKCTKRREGDMTSQR